MPKLDLIQTLAFAGLALFLGVGVRRALPVLARYSIPAPVIGGLLVAAALSVVHAAGATPPAFDTTLQMPLMIAFFTTIGFGASVRLLRAGGRQVLLFLALAGAFAAVQNVVGAALAAAMGRPPLFGVLVGSVTLAGGPGTGLAFAERFEAAGIEGARVVAVAAAMVGILAGGVLGGPIGTRLIERFRLAVPGAGASPPPDADGDGTDEGREAAARLASPAPAGDPDPDGHVLLASVVLILVAMWAGSGISGALVAAGINLPPYIGAMVVAAALRNLDDATGWLRLSPRTMDHVGSAALALFIAMALMTQPLWQIAGLALPMLAILAVQVAVIALACRWVWRWMGGDYEAAVMSAGFAGFMLGITANAVANMRSLVERFGPAPRAFLIVPMVGAFFIDFLNALLITLCLNVLR